MKANVIHKQSILDLSIQLYGSIDEVFALAVANNLSVTAVIPPNTIIEVPEIEVSEPLTRNYYKSKNLKPSTALNTEALQILENNDPCDICALFL